MIKTRENTSANIQISPVNECCNPVYPSMYCSLCLPIYLIFTYFLWAALLPPWITKLGTSPSLRIVCLNWKVRREKPTNVANHFRTTFHFSPPFFFISLSIIFICHAAREGRFLWDREGEQKGERWAGEKKDGEMVMVLGWLYVSRS